MFARSRPFAFASYGSRRSRWRLPRWLVLLLAGTAAGAAAVVVIQERYLPPRLSASESVALRSAFERAEVDRLRLSDGLGQTTRRLETALAERKAAADELAASRATATRLHDDLAAVVATLPPDPRVAPVAVRAGRFTAKGGLLNYDLVLTREGATGRPIAGTLQFLVEGESERGAPVTVAAKAIMLSMGRHEVLRGSLPLPVGFRPRQTTIQVLDRLGGAPLGMRVLPIK